MQVEKTQFDEFLKEVASCESFDELNALLEATEESHSEWLSDPAFLSVHDSKEAELNVPQEVVDEEVALQRSNERASFVAGLRNLKEKVSAIDDPRELRVLIALVREALDKIGGKVTKTSLARYRILKRSVDLIEAPPQMQVVVAGLLALGKDVVSRREVVDLMGKLHAGGLLETTQPPMRIFDYYLTHGTIGMKVRGIVSKL